MRKRFGILFVLLVLGVVGCLDQSAKNDGQDEINVSSVSIGYIGCSNTRETVEGYHYLGGKKMWDYERRYGSGTLLDWSRNVDEKSKYWDAFEDLLEKYPETKTIWWQLCIMDEDRTTSYEHAEIILNKMRERVSDAIIYVSALADYTDSVCTITGTWGLEKGKELAQELDEKNDDVFAGPFLGPMSAKETARDGCHLRSPDGKRKLGNQMRLFFDAEEYSADEASIGYLGCSNTMQTVAAYWLGDSSDDRVLWKFNDQDLHEYDAGAVVDWTKGAEKGNKFWKTFDRYLENSPNTKAIFWQLCIRKEEPTSYEEALPVLEAIRQRIPGVVVYVSALPIYTEGVCEITGTAGIERAKVLAEEFAAKNEDVVPGPVLGPMTPYETGEDGCHLSVGGMQTIGNQMKKFFDQIENNPESASEENIDPENAEVDLEKREFSVEEPAEEQVWRRRIEAAMKPTLCSDVAKLMYLSSDYQGPLIDTHLHIPSIPDWSPEEDSLPPDPAPEGRFGGPQALLGWNVKMSEIACTLQREGTHQNFAFFPVYESGISMHQLEIWKRTMQKYPDIFTPFIMSSGNDGQPDGFPTVDAETLTEMLAKYPKLFQGYGEIGLYARENGGSPELPPDAPRLQEIYPLVKKNNLMIYFHLGDGHQDNFENMLKQYPDIIFIWHGDQLSVNEVKDILQKYPNAYYGIDEFFGGEREIFEMYVGKSKEEYLEAANLKFDQIISQAIIHWKPLIEQYPDQVLWGTDRGDAVWNYDLELGQMQVKIARAFIGKLSPAVQEKFAYQNAEKLIAASGNG
ncbi:amidohydrolase family protein [Candidatus Woesearchaeota archaeon]|nr:amidohydrolase family protein [Candidatus Woesearchaeota archaeon]